MVKSLKRLFHTSSSYFFFGVSFTKQTYEHKQQQTKHAQRWSLSKEHNIHKTSSSRITPKGLEIVTSKLRVETPNREKATGAKQQCFYHLNHKPPLTSQQLHYGSGDPCCLSDILRSHKSMPRTSSLTFHSSFFFLIIYLLAFRINAQT